MADWTVIVDDECGTELGYHVPGVDTPNQAAAFAERIFNAHKGVGGRTKFVFIGFIEPQPLHAASPLKIVVLGLTSEEQGYT